MKQLFGIIWCFFFKCKKFKGEILDINNLDITTLVTCKRCGKQSVKVLPGNKIESIEIYKQCL